MATAIVRTCTDLGYVIAADGMQKNLDGSVDSLTKQKIFCFAGNRLLAYSFTGRIGIGPDNGDEISFDFIKEFQKAAETISAKRSRSLKEYGQSLAMMAHRKLDEVCRDPRIVFSQEQPDEPGGLESTLADVLIDGYLAGSPQSVEVRFYRVNGGLAEPQISVQADPRRVCVHGSRRITELMEARDERFWNERAFRPLEFCAPYITDALYDAILYARAYIEGCSSPEAQRIDGPNCSKIGGRIHVAAVTKDHGFEWVPGYEPIPSIGQGP